MPTKIEWTDETWNPVTGCTPVSAGCTNCYAKRFAMRRMAPEWKGDRPWSEVRCHYDRLNQPLHWRKPRRIFVCSMGDLFHEAVPDVFIGRVVETMCMADRHVYQILSKRPERMRKFMTHYSSPGGPLPPWKFMQNIWLGVSVEDQKTADERIPVLLQTPAAVRFVSVEPMIGPVSLRWLSAWPDNKPHTALNPSGETDHLDGLRKLDWVICGGETGPGARPMHPGWAQSLRDECAEAKVPFFFKGWGEWIPRLEIARTSSDVSKVPWGTLGLDGHWFSETTRWNGRDQEPPDHEAGMVRVGKKRAGRLLDGREWSELPEGRTSCDCKTDSTAPPPDRPSE